MNAPLPDNVVPLFPRRPRATRCLDCDPAGAYPFRIAVHADARTGEILTPCPACGRHALVDHVAACRERLRG
ncbi:MAG TPA: hypothetical protein VFM53_03305 [Anaeromyxobacteraceae bacterium]|nr:hypothetical protein [Anaeromyxobacteraceae bacterium]